MPQLENVAEKVDLNWDALSSDPVFGDPNYKPTETIKEDPIIKDVIETLEQIKEREDAAKLEADAKAAEEIAKTQAAALVEEAKTLGLPETATKEEIEAKKSESNTDFKITLDDIIKAPEPLKEGSFKSLAFALGTEIALDTKEAFLEKYISKEEAQKQASITKENIFAELKPETAAALEMLELGVPDHLINDPTKEIEGYLKLDDAELLREELSTYPKWTEEMVNKEIEDQIENGNLIHSAAKIRAELETRKEAISLEKSTIVQKYKQQNEQLSKQKVELERSQTKEALSKVSTFMGVPIPKEVIDNLIIKYNSGLYDKELSKPESNANYILNKELESKISKYVQNKASADAKKKVNDELLNIPPVSKTVGSKVITNENKDNNWAAMEKDFG